MDMPVLVNFSNTLLFVKVCTSYCNTIKYRSTILVVFCISLCKKAFIFLTQPNIQDGEISEISGDM